MYSTTISSKNQITLPKALMNKLGLYPHKKIQLVDINEHEGSVVLKPIPTTIVNQLAGSLTPYISEKKLHTLYEDVYHQTQKEVARYLAKKK